MRHARASCPWRLLDGASSDLSGTVSPVPLYEYRCVTCDDVFEARRAMADADTAVCPSGHADVRRLLSVFAAGRGASAPAPAATAAPMRGCGGGCACH